MDSPGYHLVFRAVDSRVIAPDVASQRCLAEVIHAVGEPRGLLAFRASGDHLHVEAVCDRATAGRLGQAVASGLTQRLGLPGFAPVYVEPLADQRHLENVFFYVLRNTEKHGVGNDPTHEASSIGALLGLRLAPEGFLTRVRRHVPRLDRDALLDILGIATLVPAFRLDVLADAAAGALGLPDLDTSARAARARSAAVRVAAPHARAAAVAGALGIAPRTERRYRSAPPDLALERAIALRTGLLLALGDRAQLDRPLIAEAPRPRRATRTA